MNESKPLPQVQAGLGDTLFEVSQHSSHRFSFEQLQDDDLVALDQPLRFRFAGPGPFEVPPSRFLALNCTATLVVAIEAATHLEYLSREQALELADTLAGSFAGAGWTRQDQDPRVSGRGELTLRLRDPQGPDDANWYIASHALGSARLLTKLRRTHRSGRMADHDLFLLNLQWRDQTLARKADEIVMLLRNADGQPPQQARRIELERYTARVRHLLPR